MRQRSLTLILAGMCVPALTLSVAAVQPAKQHSFSFNTMFPTMEGKIKYQVYTTIPVYEYYISPFDSKPEIQTPWEPDPYPSDPPPSVPVLVNHNIQVTTQYLNWYSPYGLFPEREITQQQAFAKGLTQTQLNAIDNLSVIPVNRTLHPIKHTESSVALDEGGNNGYQINKHLASGSVVLNVTIPSHPGNKWRLKVIDALGKERYGLATLEPGQHKITVTDVEAGNVLVSLAAINSNNEATTFFQEAYALVRKNNPGVINMEFAAANSSSRYRIGHLTLGHNSQRHENPLPLQKGREAMVRVMVYDAYGDGVEPSPVKIYPVRITWSSPGGSGTRTINSRISGYHTESGRDGGVNAKASDIGPTIQATHIQAGLTVKAELLAPSTNAVLDTKTIAVQVAQPRVITLRGYDCRPAFGSGVPLIRSEDQMNRWVLPFTRDAFPFSEIKYSYKGKVWVPKLFGLITGKTYLASVMAKMNIMQGWHDTSLKAQSETLYLGMTNSRYGGEDPTGMAWYKNRGLAISCVLAHEPLGYLIAHEMGHCFGLYHAPSEGAEEYFLGVPTNVADHGYPYGGGGLAGGWGYTNIYYDNPDEPATKRWKRHFLAENIHTEENMRGEGGVQIHWDVMSYPPVSRTHKTVRFSDYNAERFMTTIIESPAPVFETSDIQGIYRYPGTSVWVFGSDGAGLTETRIRLQKPETKSLYDVDSYNNTPGGVPLDFTITSSALTSDPDGDGSGPPEIIVTRLPRLKGITSDD